MAKRTNVAGNNITAKAATRTMSGTTSKTVSKPPSVPTGKQRMSKNTAALNTAALNAAALNPAARRRANQRRKERITRHVQRLEAVLPGAAGGIWRPSLPQVSSWPLWQLMRARWFLFAGILLAVTVGLATWVHSDERWFLYREDARFSGLTYLREDELWSSSEIDGWNMFWLDTGEVRRRLLANPYVADADVYISPIQGTVHVDVTEAQPNALWVTDDGTRWLLPNGTAVEPRGSTPPGLMQIIDGGAMATAPGVALGSAIDSDVLASAASLLKVLPGVAPLRYNRQIGLNFQLQDKPYWVYWGDGANVERKLDNLAAAVQLLEDGTLDGTVIDVRFERPYVK
jgi:cell division septal protein FtsQ